MANEALLQVAGLSAGYGDITILRDVAFAARAGEVTCIMGRNGAGKTTLMKALVGVVRPSVGQILLGGEDIARLSSPEIAAKGLAWVPQGRRLFGPLTVEENLQVGLLLSRDKAALRQRVLRLFPRLEERLGQAAGTLSGGEQQMLAIARALCLEPKILLLDEPTEGLQPSMIALIRDVVLRLKEEGVAVVLVEQRVEAVLKMADRVSFMAEGRVAETLDVAGLTSAAPQFRKYVGV